MSIITKKEITINNSDIHLTHICKGYDCPYKLDCLRCLDTISTLNNEELLTADMHITGKQIRGVWVGSVEGITRNKVVNQVIIRDSCMEEDSDECLSYIPENGIYMKKSSDVK